MAEHHTRKNRNPFYMGPRFTTVLKENLGDRAVFIVARKEGRIVGFSIHMRNSPAMSLKFVGIDESSVKSRDAVYFNVTYHELIERACALGCRQLYLGILTYEPKVRRGARLVPTSSWIWHPRPVRRVLMRGFLTAQARWQRRVLRKWLDMNRTAQDLPCYQWPPRPRGGGD